MWKILFLLVFVPIRCTAFDGKRVHEVIDDVPEFPRVDVSDQGRFLNDLMLSPLWKVDKDRDGVFRATARSIVDGRDDCGGQFLFEFLAQKDGKLPEDYRIRGEYLSGRTHGRGDFTSFRIEVVFKEPDLARMALGASGKEVAIPVFERYEKGLSLNSGSDLAVKLSSRHDIYVILHEQGADPKRRATFDKLPATMRELAGLAASPATYRVEERYAAFFSRFFVAPLLDREIKRFPGIQGCDTFYGYFRVTPGTSYAGLNIKISHPVYCPDEGTRKHDRLRKAEYPGTPYQAGDVVFFLIEDNGVYVSAYNERFGYFSGKERFEGTLEVLNDRGEILLTTKDRFTGWEQ